MNLSDMINNALEKREETRKEIKENSGYFVQFCPCGHVFELAYNSSLIIKAKKWESDNHVDALTLHTRSCPVCNPSIKEDDFIKRLL